MVKTKKARGSMARVSHTIARAPLPLRPKNPVFLIGCARSGTSILKRLIATHADVVAFPSEANQLWHPTGYPWRDSDHTKPPLWADPETFTRLSLEDWRPEHPRRIQREFAVYQLLHRRRVFLNKSAMIAFMLPEVQEHFPKARFVHIVRDGRSVALSYARKEYAKMEANPEPYRTHGHWCTFDELLDRMAANWQQHIEEIDRVVEAQGWRDLGIYYECHYEDFCKRPRALLGEISEFLGLDPSRLGFRDETRVRDMNYKLFRELSEDRIRSLSRLMIDGLRRKGYAIDRFEERVEPAPSDSSVTD